MCLYHYQRIRTYPHAGTTGGIEGGRDREREGKGAGIRTSAAFLTLHFSSWAIKTSTSSSFSTPSLSYWRFRRFTWREGGEGWMEGIE